MSEHKNELRLYETTVNLVALGSGVSMGFLCNSPFGLEDLSIMRAIPNMNISAPADCAELGKMLEDYTINERGPSYIRLSGVPGYKKVYDKDYKYNFGRPVKLSHGKDILILTYGSMVSQCLGVSKLLKKKISVELLNVHTIKPLNKILIKSLKNIKK